MKKFIVFLLVFLTLSAFGVILNTRPAFAASASLSLSPASSTKTVNEVFSVDIVLDTGGDAVGGATAILTYDTTKLSPTGTALTPGSIFGSTAPFTNTIDTTTGTIRYDSGTLSTAYTGRGTLATMSFRAIAVGTAPVNFTFNPGATTGTSLVAASTGPTNLLSTVNNGTYTITAGSTSTLPPTGAVEDTLMILSGGVVFLGIGFILARKAFLGV